MTTTLLIGHRGVGKTSLLQRVQNYLGDRIQAFDLDQEIEKRTGRSISDIFAKDQENGFRDLEEKVLAEILQEVEKPSYISLGAGFCRDLPENVEVLWVRRETDGLGRIFLDRPRLNKQVSALDEFLERFQEREERYTKMATRTLVLRESTQAESESERAFFCNIDVTRVGLTTLMPQESVDVRFCERVELRDDLFSKEELQDICNNLPADRMLFSCRSLDNGFVPPQGCQIDWALELGEPQHHPTIVSCHNPLANESLSEFFLRLTQYEDRYHLKAAPQIETFEDLLLGHQWQQEDSSNRSFLPMSPRGRWKWYRQLMKGRSPMNFYRTSMGSAEDQPHLLEWLDTPIAAHSFAAVLGHPVQHSLTPTEHLEFFADKDMPVFAIDVQIEEFDRALPVLRQLGLKCAAVTSPLKSKAFAVATQKTPRAEKFLSANTLFFPQDAIYADNTDGVGLEKLRDEAQIEDENLTVFGGGGTLGPLRSTFPEAEFVAARSARPRDHAREPSPPQTLILAGSGEIPSHWNPKKVVDLSYTEHSPGREFALQKQARYINGLAMFRAQAQAQRAFWQPHLEAE